jgi:hypothetical protein
MYMTTKTCSKCHVEKPIEEFVKTKANRSGYHSWCRECFNAYYRGKKPENAAKQRAWRKANPDKQAAYRRKHHLKVNYGMSPEETLELLDRQNGRCAICMKHIEFSGRGGAVVDHDHVTGEVRGVLCSRCNSGVGLFEEDCRAMSRAIDYLSHRMHRKVI